MSKYVLHTDVVFSRRKTLHHILDEHNQPVFSAKLIAPCLAWLAENGVYEFRLQGIDPDHGFEVMIHAD